MESLDTIPLYATLSYCWGREPFKKLTTDALSAFLKDIPLQHLPQTFQDAIDVTRGLGLDYVWIDALCIIQNQQVGRGEETDWEKEVGKMESVYGGAHVSLAASDAKIYQIHSPAGRAWALQEKLLAARTISFGRGGLFWECKSTIKSEYLPNGFQDRLGRHVVRPENMTWDWDEIVQDYSSAALTVDSDRLPALAGIARRQHELTGDQYLAGMW
ncbi:HET-domain-containing protein, partial [Apiospora marii]|uniref:HET-domain-containing protein n=1 Tax=Apiospora marii TaxID=335849 RepID=UPI0031326CE1